MTGGAEGVGLGLALTARIVAELGGTIEASNRTDGVRGARFRVRVPGRVEGVGEETEG